MAGVGAFNDPGAGQCGSCGAVFRRVVGRSMGAAPGSGVRAGDASASTGNAPFSSSLDALFDRPGGQPPGPADVSTTSREPHRSSGTPDAVAGGSAGGAGGEHPG
ncbi:MAG: hypothetical protein KatS3mg027_0005 [Bacteroidia bacterium]|nr:MAG: hypothetical protein KatS3mg027_0005 [Bacteroidia bacterium]